MAVVHYDSVSKRFGAVEIMRDLSLHIEEGEFAVLLGASGCGKTTLLRMTAGLETITSGDLIVDGARMNDVHPRDRDIAMVFQNYALYPTMKVRENIGFSLEIRKLGKDEIRRRVEQAAEVLNLTEYLDRYPKELSGGQRQRVAMGRAMVRDAKLFLFDEPLSNLDAKLRAAMRIEIRELHDRLGATTIYVTHDQIEAMTMADKIVLMNGGEIEQVGSPDDLYDRPASIFAADFIGTPSMNFFEGVVEAEAGAPIFRAPGVSLPLDPASAPPSGTKATCGLRPTDLALDGDGGVEGVLALAEKTGAEQNLLIDTPSGRIICCASRDVHPTPGAEVRFSIPAAKIHLFEPTGGKRLG